MTDFGRQSRCRALAGVLAVSLSVLAVTAPDRATGQAAQPGQQQPGQQQPAQTAAPPGRGLFPSQPPPTYKPGFIYAFGQWWDTARGKIEELKSHSNDAAKGAVTATQDAMNHAAAATRNAANALIKLPGARFIETYQRCQIAPNGAPDCRTAAAAACRAKGFTDGHPANVQSSENCPPAVWMSGREPTAGECPEETVVLLAACD